MSYTSYQQPSDTLEYKVREEDGSVEIGRPADKDDYKRQFHEARTQLKQQMHTLKESVKTSDLGTRATALKDQVMASDMGQKAMDMGERGAAKAREAINIGTERAKDAYAAGKLQAQQAGAQLQEKLSDLQQQQKDRKLQEAAQPLLPADQAGMFSPEAPVQQPEIRHHKHTSHSDYSFSSIPDPGSKPYHAPVSSPPVRDEETMPLLGKQASSSGGLSDTQGITGPQGLDASHGLPGLSGDPLPTSGVVPPTATLDSDTCLGVIEGRAAPMVQKAKSLYSIWKNGENGEAGGVESQQASGSSSGSSGGMAAQAKSMFDTSVKPALESAAANIGPALQTAAAHIKPTLSAVAVQAQHLYEANVKPAAATAAANASRMFEQQVKPAVSTGLNTAQEQIGVIREEGIAETVHRAQESIAHTYEEQVPAEHREKIREVRSGLMSRVRLGWNKVLDVWEGEEPIVREYVARAVTVVKRNRMEIPLMALGALLVLWASASLIGWMALSGAPQHNPDNLPVVYTPDWRPSTGPIQGPELPGLTDKLKAPFQRMDSQLRDGMDSIRESAEGIKATVQERAAGLKDSMQAGAADLKDRAADLKDSMQNRAADVNANVQTRAADLQGQVQDSMPSTQDVQESMNSIRGSIDRTVDSLKDRVADAMPSMDEVKGRVNDIQSQMPSMPAVPTMGDMQQRAAAGLEAARQSMQQAPDLHTHTHTHTHTTAGQQVPIATRLQEGAASLKDRIVDSDIGLKLQDRLSHMADILPNAHTVEQLQARASELRDGIASKLMPGEQAPPADQVVLDPENHVVEEMDSHHHVKERIEL